MKKIICASYDEASECVCTMFARQIQLKPHSVLGLATGSTPIGLYKKLTELHNKGGLDFSGITTYNLDEYYPISKNNNQSYYYFMFEHLFSHININKGNIYIPNGEAENAELECAEYEKRVCEAGLDIQLLGIGINGHIGFNEPGPTLNAATHIAKLTESTIQANARFFDSKEDVPKTALTMGMGTIMQAKEIILMAFGKAKAAAIGEIFSGKIHTNNPATFLQLHPNVTLILDNEAAGMAQ